MTPVITVIGCDGGPLSPAAAAALAGARCVAGPARHLAAAPVPPHADRIEVRAARAPGLASAEGAPGRRTTAGVMPGQQGAAGRPAIAGLARGAAGAPDRPASWSSAAFGEALDAILAHTGPVAVLASGDPGFFGIVRALAARGAAPAVIPGVSSVALAFARLGLPWDDALVLSAHGRDPRPVLAAALACHKAAILTAPGPATGPRAFVPALLAAGRSVYVAQCLGTAAEKVRHVVAGTRAVFRDPNVVLTLDADRHQPGPRWLAGHQGAPDGWALPEDAFTHRDSMITKAEVRAVVLARLGPGPGRTVWDVGAGAGSVAVECARFGSHAIAVEGDPAQCARIRANAAAHGVYVQVAEGRAPQALDGLMPADAVFVGGGDDRVVAVAAARRPARMVVGLASLDRVRTVRDLLGRAGYRVGGAALQASRLAGLPTGSVRLAAVNPVVLVWGDRP